MPWRMRWWRRDTRVGGWVGGCGRARGKRGWWVFDWVGGWVGGWMHEKGMPAAASTHQAGPRLPASLHVPAPWSHPAPVPPDADEVDFDGFLRMLRVGSYDSLDALDQARPALPGMC